NGIKEKEKRGESSTHSMGSLLFLLFLSKEFVRTLDSTLLDFVTDLETKMKMGSRQLENIYHGKSVKGKKQCSHEIDRRAVCDYEKESPAHMNLVNASSTDPISADPEKPSVRQRKSTQTRTEWSGPPNSCARIYNDLNATKYINITNYPSNVAEEVSRRGILADDICGETLTKTTHDNVAFPRRLRIPNWPLNKRYDVNLKHLTKTDETVVRMEVRDGCMVTLYQHFFDKITKKSKNSPENVEYCTYDNFLFNWPLNKRYYVNFVDAELASFKAKTLKTTGYGHHKVDEIGTERVVCECMY
uniref:Uncharacterized protein n=1 Tax=Pristionchus pacificus TaxID=54126 RepID=A0A8R1UPL1_PRIPA